MLHASGLPKFLWGEAINHAVYLKNRTGTKALDGKMPYKAFHETKPNLHCLPEFGSQVWVHDTSGSKLDGQAMMGRWVGFDEESSGHQIYFPGKQTVAIEHSVKFDPTDVKVYLPQVVSTEGEQKKSAVEQLSKSFGLGPVPQLIKSTDVDPLGNNFEKQPDIESRPKRIRQESATIKRLRASEGVVSGLPKERGQLPKGVQQGSSTEVAEDDEVATTATVAIAEVDEVEPSYEEARLRSDWPEWRKAIDVELQNADTWDIVERPGGVNVVDSKWVFHLKKDAEGRIVKWKARLVARGFTQV
jgi:Reverse transcriptase (RNA-dependent DNA polymerase)